MSTKIYFFADIYISHINDEFKLSRIRNDLLVKIHKKLPSYCYWSGEDIIDESLVERFEWLKSFAKENDNLKLLH